MSDTAYTAHHAAQEPFLPLMRQLVRTYQALEHVSSTHIRQMGLTSAQFDVIATLGNTSGMTMNVLADKTLVTKGTLTGIIDRLEQKGLVQRVVPPEDRRCFTVHLTTSGEDLFYTTFPAHIAYLKPFFTPLSPDEALSLLGSLKHLQTILEKGDLSGSSCALGSTVPDDGDHA
ncbi:MAG: MarR family transcriptional regulator [Synechococcales cyanobacterium]